MTRKLAAATCVAALVLAGCGDGDKDAGESDGGAELTVSAASSLTGAFEAYGEETDGEEKFSFAGSDDLAAQIRSGAPVDVFASANTSLPDDLFAEDLVEEPQTFIANQLVLAVPADSDVESIDDLPEANLNLVIGAEGVPVGDYTREVLGKLPKVDADAILAQVRSEEPEVKGIVGKLVAGAADAGFVYASDVEAAPEELRAIELPEKLEPVVMYGVAVVADSENAEEAREFVDGLIDGAGQDALIDAGFLPVE